MVWGQTDFSAEPIEAGDEDVGGEEPAHGLPPVDGELPAVQVLVDLLRRRQGPVIGGPRLPQPGPLGVAAVLGSRPGRRRRPLGGKHGEQAPAQQPT